MFDLNELYKKVESPLKVVTEASSPVSPTKELSSDIPKIFSKHSCESTEFSYLVEKSDIIDYQHVWLFLKLLSHISRESSSTLEFFMTCQLFKSIWYLEGASRDYIEKAVEIFPILMNVKKRVDYSDVVDDMYELSKDGDTKQISNFTSLVNFLGHETYFTRGAFLKTVVNKQLCNNKSRLQLSVDALVDSCIENLFDFFFYFKSKYLERALESIKEIQINECGDYEECDFTEVYIRFNILEQMTNSCKGVCDFNPMIPLITSIVKFLLNGKRTRLLWENSNFRDLVSIISTPIQTSIPIQESDYQDSVTSSIVKSE
jgi:hypothetical protein